jgi:hypothetical protein
MPDYLVTDPATGQRIKMTGPAPPSEALIRLALAQVKPLASHDQLPPPMKQGPEQPTNAFGQTLPLSPEQDYPSKVTQSILGLIGLGDDSSKSNQFGQLVGAAMPIIGGIKKLAVPEAVGEGLYSRLDRAIAGLPDTKLPPMKILSTAKNATSGEEIATRGLADFLQAAGGKPVARADVQAHLAANPIQLDVKTLGEVPEQLKIARRQAISEFGTFPELQASLRAKYGSDAAVMERATPRELYGLDLLGGAAMQPENLPKYSQYQVPGGTAYKETLITLPPAEKFDPSKVTIERQRPSVTQGSVKVSYDGKPIGTFGDPMSNSAQPPGAGAQSLGGWHGMSDAEVHALVQRRFNGDPTLGIKPLAEMFRSSHFEQPNILVHVRSNERTLPSGETGLFLEEVQSDWHQKGKAEGYQVPPPPALSAAEGARLRELTMRAQRSPATGLSATERTELNDLLRRNTERQKPAGVPDAPFKEQWPDLALKHQLLDAAKRPDLQWLGFTSGETQGARYDLSKTLSEVHYSGTNFKAYDHNGNTVISKSGILPEDLPDLIGKEAADRLLAQPKQGTLRSLTGQELKIEAKGMMFFYDQLLPKRLEKIVKPFGGTVERAPVSGTNAPADVIQRYANQPDHPFTKTANTPAWIVRLTPEMKQRILKEGLPLMTGVAAVAASQQEQK